MELEGFSFTEDTLGRSPSDESDDFEEGSLSPNSPSTIVDTSMAMDDNISDGTVVINTSQILRDDPDEDGPSINSFWLEEPTFDEINKVEPKTEPEDRTEDIDTRFLVDTTKKEAFDDVPEDFVRSAPGNMDDILEVDVSKSQSNTAIDGTITCEICHPKYTTLLYTDADLEVHNLHYHSPPILPEKPFKCFYEGCEAVFKLRTPWGKASFQY